jgi:hypothetical protein
MVKDKIELPDSWDEIKVKTWRELNQIQSESEMSVLIQRLSVLADVDQEQIRQLPVPEFNKLVKGLSFISQDLKPEPKLRFEVKGKRYGMIPDLNFISTGEFVDAEQFKKDPVENIHYLAALIYRPIIWEEDDDWKISPHTSQGFQKRADLFLNELPITTIYGAVLFFSASGIQSTEIIVDYLTQMEQQTTKKTKKTKTQSHTKKKRGSNSKKTGRGTTS